MQTLWPRAKHAAAILVLAFLAEAAFAQVGAIELTGDVLQVLRLDRAALLAEPEPHWAQARVTREIDGKEQSTTVRGVRLKVLLERAGLAERDRFDWRKAVVIASARDGYRVVFSWPELFNTTAGGQVLVLTERDGAPLGDNEGPLALLAAGDVRTGPRHVRALDRIEVRLLRD